MRMGTPVTEGRQQVRLAQSRLYRAITRAHLAVVVVNECIRDGFLEYLTKVRFDEGEGGRFDEEEEGKRRVKGAAQQVLEQAAATAAAGAGAVQGVRDEQATRAGKGEDSNCNANSNSNSNSDRNSSSDSSNTSIHNSRDTSTGTGTGTKSKGAEAGEAEAEVVSQGVWDVSANRAASAHTGALAFMPLLTETARRRKVEEKARREEEWEKACPDGPWEVIKLGPGEHEANSLKD